VSGKPFDKKKEHEDHTAYGKAEFTSKVVRRKAATIDFSGFDELLERIALCLLDYKTKKSVETTPPASVDVAVSL
jgi:RNA-directed DNA polymerase